MRERERERENDNKLIQHDEDHVASDEKGNEGTTLVDEAGDLKLNCLTTRY